LRVISPFLTIRRRATGDAARALNRIAIRKNVRDKRDREIIAAYLSGRSKNSIAQAFEVAYGVVSKVIGQFERGPAAPKERGIARPIGSQRTR
jgi:hypothetical protein